MPSDVGNTVVSNPYEVGLGTGAQRQYKFYWLLTQPVYRIRSVYWWRGEAAWSPPEAPPEGSAGGAFLRDLASLEHKKLSDFGPSDRGTIAGKTIETSSTTPKFIGFRHKRKCEMWHKF